jgi:predicted phosphodiesterase
MRIAVFADIHGNILALESVLSDIRARGVDLIVNLGDCVSGPLWPRETFERLQQLDAPTARGNHDRQVATFDRTAMGASDRFAFDELSAEQRDTLGQLPFTETVGPGIVGLHATPTHDDRYLLDEITGHRLARAPLDKITQRLGSFNARIVLVGHSHRPGMVKLETGVTIINPGSVGCPAYHDPTGRPHFSETGTPHARYAIVEDDGGSEDPAVTFSALSYSHEDAARRAEANDRPEWAHALRTGFMPAKFGSSST